MTDTATRKCIEQGLTSIESDTRVSYPHGLVLGVDEFVQEQRYFLEKNYLHNRSLHGYGTVFGLELRLGKENPPPDSNNKASKGKVYSLNLKQNEAPWIFIDPGVGIDQHGRTFVIRETQCANLLDWWNANKDRLGLDKNNEVTLYIRGRYDELCGQEEMLAGKPCTIEAENSANTRIFDTTLLEISTEKPEMRAWELVQRFAWLKDKIWLVPGIDYDWSLEDLLLDYIRDSLAMDNYQDTFNNFGVDHFELPIALEETHATLHKLNNAFVTYVAPKAYTSEDPYNRPLPDTDFTNSDTDILLGTLYLDISDDPNKAPIETVEVDYDNRPYLLSTQVIQETSFADEVNQHIRKEFASLNVISPHSLYLWMHHNIEIAGLLIKQGAVELWSDGQLISAIDMTNIDGIVSWGNAPRGVLKISVDKSISSSAAVEMRFDLNNLPQNLYPIHKFTTFVGFDKNGIITIHAFADNLPNVHDFALVSVRNRGKNNEFVLEVHFNLHAPVTALDNDYHGALSITDNDGNDLPATDFDITSNNDIWEITISPNTVVERDLLTFNFDVHKVLVDGQSLMTFMEVNREKYAGYDALEEMIKIPTIVEISPIISEDEIKEVVDQRVPQILKHWEDTTRTIPFATITPQVSEADNTRLEFELWLHATIRNPKGSGLKISFENSADAIAIYDDNPGGNPRLITYTYTELAKNLISLLLNDTEQLPQHLRFVFALDKLIVSKARGQSQLLSDFMREQDVRFDGYYKDKNSNQEYVVMYVRNTLTI